MSSIKRYHLDLDLVATLIGCEATRVIEALTKRTVAVNNESVQTNLSCSEVGCTSVIYSKKKKHVCVIYLLYS